MSDKDREYKEFLRLFEKEHSTPDDTHIVNQRQKQISAKRQASKKRRQRQRITVSISALVLLLLIVIVAVISKSCLGNKNNLAILQGVWHYDQYTEYEFDGKGNGCMCIEETNHYEFTYTIDGNTLKIDFALDYVTDCEYNFKIENDKLTLIGGKGTANLGQEYTLERVQ